MAIGWTSCTENQYQSAHLRLSVAPLRNNPTSEPFHYTLETLSEGYTSQCSFSILFTNDITETSFCRKRRVLYMINVKSCHINLLKLSTSSPPPSLEIPCNSGIKSCWNLSNIGAFSESSPLEKLLWWWRWS
jgi:hypothetical protein